MKRLLFPLLLALGLAQGQGQFLDLNGARIHYTSAGSGPAMLLIHGYPLSGELFQRNRDALARAGYRVITPDLRGFGRSDAPASDPGSLRTYAADMLALMDGLGLRQAVVGGMSMGGAIAFEMYRQAPGRFTGLLLISTVANPPSLVEQALWGGMAAKAQTFGPQSLVPELIKDMLTGKTQAENPALVRALEGIVRQASVRGDVAGARALASRPDALPLLPTIRVPTLILVGQEDTVYPVALSQKMRQNIPGSKLVVIPGASHAAIIEAAADANRAILEWARGLRQAEVLGQAADPAQAVSPQPQAPAAQGQRAAAAAQVTLPGSNVFPEGIAYDPRGRVAYAGSSADGTLYRIGADGKAEVLALGGSPGRATALGMKLDPQGNLWVAAGTSGKVAVVRTSDGATLRVLDSPRNLAQGAPSPEPFINDLTLAPDGSVYVTDSFRPVLLRVAPGGSALEPWLDLSRTPIRYAPGINLNGIVATPDGRYLIAVQSNTGQLWRFDTASKAVREVSLGGARLQNGDGLVLSGRDLWVVRNAESELVRVAMSADFASGTVAGRVNDPAFRFPTTAALAEGRLWVVNSQLDKQRDPPPVLPFTVVALPLP